MTNQHPITPPPELVEKWYLHNRKHKSSEQFWQYCAALAAQWGADQELEACCEWLGEDPVAMRHVCTGSYLRTARRPKPATLNSIALQMLGTIEQSEHFIPEITDTIRRALEQL